MEMLSNIDYAKRAKDAGLNIYFIAEGDRGEEIRCQRAVPANPNCNSYSIAKAFVVTAFGILYDRGVISPEMKVYDILSDRFPRGFDPNWKEVTLRDVMLHRIGIAKDCIDIDNETGETYPKDTDYLGLLLSSPLPNKPGSAYKYNDAGYYLLSRVIERVAGEGPDAILRPIVMKVMGFKEFAWSVCPDGYCIGATGLYIRTEDMVKLGILYMNGGVWNGVRILSEEWVSAVLENGYEIAPKGNGWYGKGGMRGQMLAFHPTLGRAVAWHAFEDVDFEVMLPPSDTSAAE